MLKGVDEVIKKCKPDIVLVHGDTLITLNGELAAFYNQVSIGHVEAGLKSHDMYSSFSEEFNRNLTGALTTLHLSSTITNKKNLLAENISEEKIRLQEMLL